MRDFEDWAGAEWNLETAHTEEEMVKGRQILADLHRQRWHRDGGAFGAPRFDAFHAAYMPLCLRDGQLQISWLCVRGVPMVASYQIVANKKVYYYQCGRSLNVPEPVRPGIVMVTLALQRALADGLREFDFLGGPAQYKSQFTDVARPILQLRVTRGGVREWLRRGAESAIGCARFLRNKVRSVRAQRIHETSPSR